MVYCWSYGWIDIFRTLHFKPHFQSVFDQALEDKKAQKDTREGNPHLRDDRSSRIWWKKENIRA